MMRLVIQYGIGDGYTWHADHTVPVVYESAEAFLVDFEEIAKDLFAKHGQWSYNNGNFVLGGQEFNYTNFFEEGKFYAPEIMTVDEWFQANGLE